MAGAEHLAAHEGRIAWILGSSRSGSTWLVQMLGSIERAAAIDDPHLGHHLGVWRPLSLAWAAAEEEPELTTLSELKKGSDDYFFSERYRDAWLPALRDLVLARFGAQADDQVADGDPVALFVKEPGSQAAPLIFEAFPRSRLIFLLRDGRDVVDSWLAAYRDGSWAIDGGAFAAARSGRDALIRWLSSVWAFRTRTVAKVFAGLGEERRVMVRYEDLLRDPAASLQRICSTFGIEARGLAEIAERHRFSRIGEADRGEGRRARSASPGSWRETMSRREQRAMEEVMGPVLAECGYRRQRGFRAVA